MSLGNTADCGVAGHLRDEIDVQREEGGFQPHASSGHCGLAACVTGAHHDDVELFGELLHFVRDLTSLAAGRDRSVVSYSSILAIWVKGLRIDRAGFRGEPKENTNPAPTTQSAAERQHRAVASECSIT